jgi:hypothetical protein
VTYYVLKVMSWLGLVWDLKRPSARVFDPTSPDRVAVEAPTHGR